MGLLTASRLRTIAILAGGAVAFWISIGVTLNFTIARRAPGIGASWWPVGTIAKVVEAQQKLTSLNTISNQEIDRLRTVLRSAALREPVNTEALSTLAAFDEYRGDIKRARLLFNAAETVSRRNTFAELWLIEDAVRRGDVSAAIRHHNRAMLVSNEIRETLIPLLVSASDDPAVRHELMPLLARRPLWWREYMTQMGTVGKNAAAMMDAIRATRLDVRKPEDAALAQIILRRMVALQDAGTAILAANRLEGLTGSTRSLRDGSFETPVSVLPFAWWLRDENSIRAYRDTVPNGSTGLRVFTSSGAGGGVAQQLIGLSPGRYVLSGQAGDVPADRTARPAIDIGCNTGTALTHAELPMANGDGREFRFTFDVPATGCPLQWVTIVTAPAVDTDIWLDNLSIRR